MVSLKWIKYQYSGSGIDKLKRDSSLPLHEIIASGGAIGVETGQEKMNELGEPGVYSQDEIEWAQELGATSDDEIAQFIRVHKSLGDSVS